MNNAMWTGKMPDPPTAEQLSRAFGTPLVSNWYMEMQRFFDQALATAIKKNADYASVDRPFKNFEGVETLGITTRERSLLCRITEKLQRVVNLLDKENRVEDESIQDTLVDMAVQVALLAQMIEERKVGK
jgi:hypothetical protein